MRKSRAASLVGALVPSIAATSSGSPGMDGEEVAQELSVRASLRYLEHMV